jgi:branched-chain amino acid transport system ATP-binding protein
LATEPILRIDCIYSTYGKFDVLKGVSLEVHPGECICIIGPNGAGKSTVLKSITGFLHAHKGSVVFKDREITRLHPVEIMKRGIVYVFQDHSIFPRMKVIENLEMGAYIRKDKGQVRRDIDASLEMFPVLAEKRNELAGNMSGGQQRMLEIGRALVQRPEILLLDEPTLGLAPIIVHNIFEKIREVNEKLGKTIIIVEQNTRSALNISQRAYVLENGRNRLDGPSKDIRNNPDVIELYLGGKTSDKGQ